MVQALLEAGADANVTVVDPSAGPGWTALMYSAQNGHDLCARALLEAGARRDVKTKAGNTALGLAKRNGHSTLVSLLE